MKRVKSKVLVAVMADLTMVDPKAFWVVLDNRRWVYPYDAKGERREYRDLPKNIAGLKDDPFRSLAGELRRAGGFAKDTTPFSEFLWANSCAGSCRARSWRTISGGPWSGRWCWARAKTRSICPDGAVPRRIETLRAYGPSFILIMRSALARVSKDEAVSRMLRSA